MEHLAHYFDTQSFIPHGHCIAWRPDLLVLHVGSDILTALAYFSIPLSIGYFVHRRDDLQFRGMFWMFMAFITACGTTHLLSVWTTWVPDYVLEGFVKAATGVVSAATSLMLWRKMPLMLAIPSRNQLTSLNAELKRQVAERREAEAEVRRMNLELERRVGERTAELQRVNDELHAEIAERKRVEQEQRVLLAELDHRVKNNLATVLSISNQTLRSARSPEDFDAAFRGRIMALAEAHRLLAEGRWQKVGMHILLERALAAYRDEAADNVRVVGEPLDLPPRCALTFGMVFHELATNAAKYGALSRDGGSVEVSWTLDGAAEGRTLTVSWRERGGPGIAADAGRGFGTRFIEQSVAHELEGAAERRIEDGALEWRIVVPWQAQPASKPAVYGA